MIPKIAGITLLGQVGNGAGSIVFDARDDRTGERLAVKSVTPAIVDEIQRQTPTPEYGGDLQRALKVYLHQVRNEWRIGHRLTNLAGGHVGIPRMHGLHAERNLLLRTRGLHLVMDFAEGQSLRAGHTYSVGQMISIYRQAADILRFLHQNDIVHADMKPHHIITDDSLKVQILDLGLACHRRGHTDQVVGSVSYMAPEQLAGAGVDERTDVFGLGATIFWALTGRALRPNISGSSMMGSIDLQATAFETSVRDYNPDVPQALEDIVLRSCAPSRKARLSLTEVIRRLDRLMAPPDRQS